jgi:ADP-heptose:LPS heptosyltransferase
MDEHLDQERSMKPIGRDVLRAALQAGAKPEVWVRFPRQLGDVVFSMPFFGTLQADWNQVAAEHGHTLRWIAVGHDIGASLFAEAAPDFISETVIERRGQGKPDPWALLRRWRVQRPAAVINMSQSVRLALAAWLARVPIRAGDTDNRLSFLYTYPFTYRQPKDHLVRRFGGLQEQLTGNPNLTWLPLSPAKLGGQSGLDLLRAQGWQGEPFVALAFGTRLDAKRWFPEEEKWSQLAHLFMEQGYRVVWLGGPDEVPLGTRLAALTPGSFNITGQTSIPQACAIQFQAYGTVAVDTGLAHTSAAMGRPTVTIFNGPTMEISASPQGPHALPVRAPVVDLESREHVPGAYLNDSFRLDPPRIVRLLHTLV